MKRLFQILIIIFVMLLSACTTEDIYVDDVADESPLNIYLCSYNLDMSNLVDSYNMSLKNSRKIKVTRFQMDDIEAMYDRILRELSVGEGPDIIAIDQWTDTYIDIYKMSENNVFADMDILIENSESFDFDSYNKTALDAGILNGKRVFVPTSYSVEYQLGLEETFDYYNLEIPDEMTMDGYLNLLEEYYKVSDNEAVLWDNTAYLIAEFFAVGETIEKTEQLEKLFKLLKIENDRYVEPQFKDFFKGDPSFFEEYDPFANKEYLLVVPKNYITKSCNQLRRLYENYNYLVSEKEVTMILFKQPFKEKHSVKAYTENALAININSKQKNEAFKFVEFVLSNSTQSKHLDISELPINKETYNNEMEIFTKANGYSNSMETHFEIEDIDIPSKMKNEFIDYIQSAQSCEYIGAFRYAYINIMSAIIEDYYNDKLTFDEMIDEINNKLTIYYTE